MDCENIFLNVSKLTFQESKIFEICEENSTKINRINEKVINNSANNQCFICF